MLTTWAAWVLANTLLFFLINWSQVNWYLRYLCYFFPLAVFIRWASRLRRIPWLPAARTGSALVLALSLIALPPLGWGNSRVLASRTYKFQEPTPLLVLVPFYGMWAVVNGGNSIDGWGMSDYSNALFEPIHPHDPSMAYAIDFQEITIRGFLGAKGPRPGKFQDYEGFQSEIFAPCPGKIVFVETGNPDKPIDAPAEGLGDKVVIQCFEVFVTLGGLRSVLVQEGDTVRIGQTIGYLGNTGSPAMPHLHVHATTQSYGKDGIPVPLLFEYKFATRNMVFLR